MPHSSSTSSRFTSEMSSANSPHTPLRQIRNSFTGSKWSPISMGSRGSSTFWKTPPRHRIPWWNRVPVVRWGNANRHRLPSRRLIAALLFIVALVCVFALSGGGNEVDVKNFVFDIKPIRADLPPTTKEYPDPVKWLAENSGGKYAVTGNNAKVNGMGFGEVMKEKLGVGGRPRAALISLVRNSELEGITQSMRELEERWNGKYLYPWIFFNDEPFTDEFKAATQNLTSAKCHYEVVPKEHWSLPEWIDESRFMNSLEYLGTIGVGKGWLISYHHMCRWNSGFFYKHPILKDYDWYWRVEPDVHYYCDIDYDVFRFMRGNNMKYGFNMNILDDARSFPSLWSRTRDFATAHPQLLHPESDLQWLRDPQTGGDYNNCQFFSNLEIGSLNFWRGEANEAYFNWLDKAGGFYYERFGDAPVHTLSVGMFVPKRETWFFRDIGYQHDINQHCPPHREGKCSCEPTRLDENFYRLVPLESPQKKPLDTCIRQFLGGDWLKKKEGWTMAGAKAFGGDGYHGYELLGRVLGCDGEFC